MIKSDEETSHFFEETLSVVVDENLFPHHVRSKINIETVLSSGVVTLILLNLDLHDAFSFGRCCKHFFKIFLDKQHFFRRLEMEFEKPEPKKTTGQRRGKGAAKKNRLRMEQQKNSPSIFTECAAKYQVFPVTCILVF